MGVLAPTVARLRIRAGNMRVPSNARTANPHPKPIHNLLMRGSMPSRHCLFRDMQPRAHNPVLGGCDLLPPTTVTLVEFLRLLPWRTQGVQESLSHLLPRAGPF